MKIKFLPQTRFGKWSIAFICAFIIILWIFFLIAKTAEIKGDSFFDTLSLAIPLLLAGISGVMALIYGTISIIKSKERSVFVFLASLLGFLVLLFTLGELFVDHT
ncbi:MAG: hypothetical protein HKO92_01570 [Flavobacteriaceae bacterium]|nr:hypothetical protein [Flavobacteriaceae bacterium]